MKDKDRKEIIPRHISTGISARWIAVRKALRLACETCGNGSVTSCLLLGTSFSFRDAPRFLIN
jgi:hypothetical protein